MTLQEMLQERARLVAESRTLYDLAAGETRELSDEERANDDTRHVRIHELTENIAREERQRAIERTLATPPAETPPEGAGDPPAETPPAEGRDEGFPFPEYRNAFQARLGEVPEADYGTAWRDWLRTGVAEERALSQGTDTEGGFLVPPQFLARLIQAIDNIVFVRQFGTVLPVTVADSLGVPSLDTDPADADWTVELATGNEDSDMAFGARELNPHPVAKLIRVSKKLIRSSAIGVEALVQQRLAYKFGITQEKAFMSGTGAGQPLGLFTASADGISTGRDVSTGNTATELRFDGLKEAKWTLKGGYHGNAQWIFHRDGLKQIDKLKDGDGQYIWRPSVVQGEPDMLLGFPIINSEYAPNTFTTGSYVGILGDLSYYWIADALGMTVQRLVELYARTNQVGYIGRLETDGMPVLEEAFVRVTLA